MEVFAVDVIDAYEDLVRWYRSEDYQKMLDWWRDKLKAAGVLVE